MEPSFTTILINKEIKFKKAAVETLKDTEKGCIFSDVYRICNTWNVKCYLSFYPNGDEEAGYGKTLIYFHLRLGSAKKIEANVDCLVESAGASIKIDKTYETSEGWGDPICTTEELFDSSQKFFIIDEITVKVTGTLKIYLPLNKTAYPISAQWQIKEVDLEALKTSTNDEENFFLSKEFEIFSSFDDKYQLKIYPNGDIEKERGNAWIFFRLKLISETNIEAIYNFSIESAKFSEDFDYVFKKDERYGTEICSTEDLFDAEKRYFINGEMTVKINGVLMMEKENVAIECDEKVVKSDQRTNSEKDFTIIVEEKSIKVDKQLLLDSSPYFVGLFRSGMIESTEMKTTITDFDYEIVEAGIQILYNPSKFPPQFTFERMLELLRFSDKYDIQVIEDLVQGHFIKNISPTNVCALINFTTAIVSAPKLYSECAKYLIECSKESKAVHGLDTVDKDLLAKIFMETFTKIL